MRRFILGTAWIVVFLAIVCLAFATDSKKAKKKAVEPTPDPEARWICRIGSIHDCSCLQMISETNEAWIEKCAAEKDYDACMAKRPANCDIIQHADEKHPQHSCRRNCKTIAGCACDDGPVCHGPQVYHPQESDDQENQQ